jgi:ligand-binding sensor domain-containing protein
MKKNLLFVTIALLMSSLAYPQSNTWKQMNPSKGFTDIAQENDYVWATSYLGIFKYRKSDGENIANYHCGNTPMTTAYTTCVAVDRNNIKWFGTYDGGLWKFDGNTWTSYNNSNTSMTGNEINALAIDNNNVLWILNWSPQFGTSLTSYNGNIWNTYNYLYDNFISLGLGTSIAIDQNNAIWINDFMSVIKFDENGITEYYGYVLGIEDFDIQSIVVDSNNVKWFSTTNSGIIKYDDISWNIVKPSDSSNNYFQSFSLSIDKQSNQIWISSFLPPDYEFSGITKFDGINYTHYNCLNNTFPFYETKKVILDQYNNKWVAAAMAGVILFNENGLSLGITNFTAKEKSTVFPQPVKEQAKIEFQSAVNTIGEIKIYASNNKLVKQETLIKGQQEYIFQRNNLTSGIYFYSIIDNNGLRIINGKLILE